MELLRILGFLTYCFYKMSLQWSIASDNCDFCLFVYFVGALLWLAPCPCKYSGVVTLLARLVRG